MDGCEPLFLIQVDSEASSKHGEQMVDGEDAGCRDWRCGSSDHQCGHQHLLSQCNHHAQACSWSHQLSELTIVSTTVYQLLPQLFLASSRCRLVPHAANKGIGYEIGRLLHEAGLIVVLTSRSEDLGKAAVEKLGGASERLVYHPLDISNPQSVAAFAAWLQQRYGKLDILVNNAGKLFSHKRGGLRACQLLQP